MEIHYPSPILETHQRNVDFVPALRSLIDARAKSAG